MAPTIRVAVERTPGAPLEIVNLPYSARAFHDEVNGWFEHTHLGDGLVYCCRQSRADVEDDIEQDAPWYPEDVESPAFFCREGKDGGFESLTDNDIQIIREIA